MLIEIYKWQRKVAKKSKRNNTYNAKHIEMKIIFKTYIANSHCLFRYFNLIKFYIL
jgi:hypothetical protein